jgi:poly(A) polymerase/tRNA nucleotidyltransferase (CCA-adding enzyme)
MEIPKEILEIIKKLKKEGYQAFIVGGCVRDILRGVKPTDWDIATSAKPEEIQKIFKKNFYTNRFFTVTVILETQDPTLKEVEITTFRKESKYSDKRHPDEVSFAKNIEEDLSRRDFTINAMALDVKEPGELKLIDPFLGQKDLRAKIIRAVGDPDERFSEDALRMLRAIRFAASLDKKNVWEIEKETFEAIKKNAKLINFISKERIRDEIVKILESPLAYEGFLLLHQSGLLKEIIPELEKGVGVTQNRHHIYTVFMHSLLSLKYAVKYGYNLNVRLAALFHDIAKPEVKKGEGPDATFYNHDVVGAKFTRNILTRLKFPKEIVEKVSLLVRYHMFFFDPEKVSESAVRRLLRKVGKENIQELIELRIADRKGSGVPKARPYRLRYFEYLVSKVSRDPISPKMLKVDGYDVMEILKIKSGPRVGLILNALLSEVLDDPKKNEREYLEKRIKELGKLSDEELKNLAKEVEEKKMEIELEEKRKFKIK